MGGEAYRRGIELHPRRNDETSVRRLIIHLSPPPLHPSAYDQPPRHASLPKLQSTPLRCPQALIFKPSLTMKTNRELRPAASIHTPFLSLITRHDNLRTSFIKVSSLVHIPSLFFFFGLMVSLILELDSSRSYISLPHALISSQTRSLVPFTVCLHAALLLPSYPVGCRKRERKRTPSCDRNERWQLRVWG